MCAATLSFFRTGTRLEISLAYIDSITDAYKSFVYDIEHTGNNKQGQKCKLSLVPIT